MKNILAIVVTYNRLYELKNCIDALKSQSYQNFDICIINNGSTDETNKWLMDNGEGLVVINQENLGGAGGFYTGEKYAFDNGYEWAWLMDDDGIPESTQLEKLLAFNKKYPDAKVLNALVVNKDKHDELSFMFGDWDYAKTQSVEYVDIISPYNGTFIHRDVFAKVGFTKKEMFIWGDEIEYAMRIGRAGIKVYCPTNVIHYHPKERSIWQPIIPGIITKKMLIKPKHFSHYYYRNQGYIHREYHRTKWYQGLKPMFWYSIFFIIRFDFMETYKVIKYYLRGINNDFVND